MLSTVAVPANLAFGGIGLSEFQITDSLEPAQWDKFVQDHPKGSIFHTSAMHDAFAVAKNQSPLSLAALDGDGEVLALLSAVRVQTLPGPLGQISSRSIWYAEPLCRETPEGMAALSALIAKHDDIVRHDTLFTEIRPLDAAASERAALEQCGYTYEDYLNFLIDLRQSDDELWRALDHDCRRRIKGNQKKGLEIRDVTTLEGVDILYHFLSLTFARARVPLADKSLFAGALQSLQPLDQIRIFAAYFEGEPVGADVILAYKDRVFAWYGGTERVGPVNPMESLNWNGIEWGQQNGYALYDFGGAGWPNKPYGVRNFKAKFGGQLVSYGRYRKVYSSLKLTLAEKGYESLRKIVNPQKWKAAA